MASKHYNTPFQSWRVFFTPGRLFLTQVTDLLFWKQHCTAPFRAKKDGRFENRTAVSKLKPPPGSRSGLKYQPGLL
jgi:hypothetical protein